jgi:hypothetical protein
MQFDPVALINAAPATALCVLVYMELRAQRNFMRSITQTMQGLSDTMTSVQTSLELIAQLVGIKITKRKPTPVPIERKEDSGE